MLFKNKNLVSKFFKGLGVKALSATLALGVLSSGVAMDPAGDVNWDRIRSSSQPRSAIDQLGLDVEREENGNVMVTYEHEGLSYCVAFLPTKEGADSPETQRALAEAILQGRSVIDFYSSSGQAGVTCDRTHTVFEGTCDEQNNICTIDRAYGRVRCLFYGNVTDLSDVMKYIREIFSCGNTTWPPKCIEGIEVMQGEGPIGVEEKEEKPEVSVVSVEDEEEPEVPAAPEDNLEGFVPFVPAAPAVRLPNPSAQLATDRIGLDIQRLGYSNRIVTHWNGGVFHCMTFLPANRGADSPWTCRALADSILQGGNVPAFYRSAGQAGIRCDRKHTVFEGTCDEESGRCTLNREDGNAQCVFWGNEPTLVTVIKEAGRLYHEGNKAWPPEMIKDFILTEDHDEVPAADEDKAPEEEGEDLCVICMGENNDPDLGSLIWFGHAGSTCKVFFHEGCINMCKLDRCPICGKKCRLEKKSK